MNYVSIILNRPACDKDTLLLSPAEMCQKKKYCVIGECLEHPQRKFL